LLPSVAGIEALPRILAESATEQVAERRAAWRVAMKIGYLLTIAQSIIYWEIERGIVDSEQRGKKRAGYGEALLERLAADLTAKFGRGFGVRNRWIMRRFFVHWPKDQIRQTVSAESQSVHQGLINTSETA
jgi:hypothetical protein